MSLFYRVGGLTLASDRPFVFLPPAPPDAVPDVTLTCAPVPPRDGTVRGAFTIISPDCVDLVCPGVMRVRVEQGCRLTLDVEEGASEGTIQTYLVGPAFAALLYQRGIPPLHAAVVRLEGDGAVAIGGQSRAGKSTTAWALMQAGHALLCDDQAVIDPRTAMVEAGFPALKLWQQSLSHFGRGPNAGARVAEGMDKFHVSAPGPFDMRPAHLRAICILTKADGVCAPELTRLSVAEAVAALGTLAHHGYLGDGIGRRLDIFRFGAALAGHVPVFVLTRPADLGQLDAVVARVREAAGCQASPAPDRAQPGGWAGSAPARDA